MTAAHRFTLFVPMLLVSLLLACPAAVAQEDPAPVPAEVEPLLPGQRQAYEPANPPTDRIERLPPELAEADFDESHLGDFAPLDLDFRDENGRAVKLADYFREGKPVILNMAYYTCPMLCSLVQESISNVVKEMDWLPGEDYQIVTVSIDPRERPEQALAKKREVFQTLDTSAADGWAFLTGREADIRSLTDAVGFGYRYVESQGEYVHAAGIIILSPEGRITRYFVMLNYPARTVRLSLVEASEGKVGSTLDRILLTCLQWNETEGRYVTTAKALMTLGGAATLIVVAASLGLLFALEGYRRRSNRLKEAA
ncbi:SCO family protein [Mucisphaera sp.]|uniref:SCO family protein n=1 Tax=Mucisphaera sp. TaxID=2913024 RepID=UPI003D11481D